MGTCAHAIVNLLFFSLCLLSLHCIHVRLPLLLSVLPPPARDVAEQNSS